MANSKWTNELITARIQELHRSWEPLNLGYIQVNHNDVFEAANRYSGGWKAAVGVAGIDYVAACKAGRAIIEGKKKALPWP